MREVTTSLRVADLISATFEFVNRRAARGHRNEVLLSMHGFDSRPFCHCTGGVRHDVSTNTGSEKTGTVARSTKLLGERSRAATVSISSTSSGLQGHGLLQTVQCTIMGSLLHDVQPVLGHQRIRTFHGFWLRRQLISQMPTSEGRAPMSC